MNLVKRQARVGVQSPITDGETMGAAHSNGSRPVFDRKAWVRKYNREYTQRPHVKAQRSKYYKAYFQRPEVKARKKLNRNRPENKAYQAEYKRRSKEKVNGWARERYKRKRDEIRNQVNARKYGITPAERDTLFAHNNGMCWVCDVKTAETIDHCHITGAVRGALCRQCNTAIGMMGDNPELVAKALEYLNGERNLGLPK
jgi:hypothetical protein